MSVAHEIKCRCASAYSSDTARFLLGDSFHPGGAQLTDRLLAALDLGPSATVLDVACGPGTTTTAIARRSRAIGIDLSDR
ncbi:MAG: methyltransferase type 11, partial [Chloroflexota bacterium]